MPRILQRNYGGSLYIGEQNTTTYATHIADASLSPGSNSFVLAWWGNHQKPGVGSTKILFSFASSTYNTDGLLVSLYSDVSMLIYTKNAGECGLRMRVLSGWHRYVLVFDAVARLVYGYTDGLLVGVSSVNWTAGAFRATGDVTWGNAGLSAGGYISDGIWDVSGNTWTAAQVLDDYLTGTIPTGANQHRWLFNEGAGSTANDTGITSSAMSLTLGNATFTTNSPMKTRLLSRQYSGSSFTLNGSSSITTTTSTALANSESWTNSWWSCSHSYTAYTQNIFYTPTYATAGFYIYYIGTTLYTNIKNVTITALNAYVQLSWHHYVTSFDGSTQTAYFYRDGVLVFKSAAAAWTTGGWTANPQVLINGQGSANAGPGYMSDMIYDAAQAWTSTQVAAYYNQGLIPTSANLHRWQMNEGYGAIANDTGTGVTTNGNCGASTIFTSNSPLKLRSFSRQYGGSMYMPVVGALTYSTAQTTFSPAGSWTVAWWQQVTDISQSATIFQYGQPTTTGFGLITTGSGGGTSVGYISLPIKGVTYNFPCRNTVSSTWNRFAVTFDTSTFTAYLYQNGYLIAQSGAALWSGTLAASDVVYIGHGTGSQWGNCGYLADIVYDCSNGWNAAQVLADYTNNIQPTSANQHRWKLDDGIGTTAADTGTTATPILLTLSAGAVFSSNSPIKPKGVVQNGIAYSNDVTNAVYAVTALTTASYGGPFPTGISTGSQITDAVGSTSHILQYQYFPENVKNKPSIFSWYAKKISGNGWLFARMYDNSSVTLSGARFDLNTGATASVTAGCTAGTLSLGSGWYRCWLYTPAISGVVASYPQIYMAQDAATTAYTANGSNTAITGIMVEQAIPGQTTPSALITTGATPLSVYAQNTIT